MRRKPSNSRKIRFSPTQKDIADALGVSQSTVAMALSAQHERKLMAETVERIRKYAAEVGYHPQRFAQIMQGGHTRIIGVIVRLGIYTTNHKMVAMLANEFTRAGYRLVVVDPEWFGGDAELVKRYLLDQGVEGVVFCNVTLIEDVEALQAALPDRMPYCSLQSSVACGPNLRADLEGAYYQMTRLHLALGSQHLALLTMYRDVGNIRRPAWTVRDRVMGFSRAIQEAGGTVVADDTAAELLEIPGCKSFPKRLPKGIVGAIHYPEKAPEVNNAFGNGFYQTLRLIDAAALPDSLICANDDGALGAFAACADRNVQVSGEVRISGHDDTVAGQFGMAPLTTVRLPLEEMVRTTAEGLLEQIRNPEKVRENSLVQLPCKIVVTSSCGSREELRQLAGSDFFRSGGGHEFEWKLDDNGVHRFDAYQRIEDHGRRPKVKPNP